MDSKYLVVARKERLGLKFQTFKASVLPVNIQSKNEIIILTHAKKTIFVKNCTLRKRRNKKNNY
jgi:hypothetical protein